MDNEKSTDERLAELEQTVAYLSRLVLKARRYAESDPEVALGQARKSAEAICYRLFQAEIGPPGKMMLEDLMTKLQAKQVLPPHVVVPLRTIQLYGNFGAHAQDEHVEVSVEWVAPCLSALAQVTNWYFMDYLGIALPTALERHEDDSRPVTRHGVRVKEPRGETAGDRPWNGQPAEPAPAPPTPSLLVVEADEGPPWRPGSVAGPSVADTLPQPDPDPAESPASEAVAAEGPVAEPTEPVLPDRPAPVSPSHAALAEADVGAVDDSIPWTPGSIAGPTVADTLPQPDPVVEPAPEVVPTDEPITGPTIPDPPPDPAPVPDPGLRPVAEVTAAPRWRPAALAGGLLLLGLGGVYLYHEVRQGDDPRPAPAVPDMVRLPAGRFQMGSPAQEPERDKDEGPQHQVQVAAFELGKTEVTRGQFKQFVQATGYRTEAEEGDGCYVWKDSSYTKDKSFNWRNVGFAQGDDSPVVCVTWNDAQRYVGWLSQATGQTWRLPTEAEWEYAARAGTTTPFSTGPCITTRQANYDGNYDYNNCGAKTGVNLQKTQPVGSYPANPWGLSDLHGNVFEWVEDCYHDSYTGAPNDGSAWKQESCRARVLRGGSWSYFPRDARAAYRFSFQPGNRISFVGFRLARTLSP